jgi:hypothetical protein
VWADWDPRTVAIRALEAGAEVESDEEHIDESSGSDDDNDDDYTNADERKDHRRRRRRRKSLKRTGTTPRKSVAARQATRKQISRRAVTADPKRTHRRPIALFEISFQKKEEAPLFAQDAGLVNWSVDAALVSAAPRERYFFSQKRPSVPLQQSTTLPLTVKEFLIAQEGDAYTARKWHKDDPREHFSTVTTKGMGDILKRFVDKANETDGDVDLTSQICTAAAPCWICKSREEAKQERDELVQQLSNTDAEATKKQRDDRIKALEKQLRKNCGNKQWKHTWLKVRAHASHGMHPTLRGAETPRNCRACCHSTSYLTA